MRAKRSNPDDARNGEIAASARFAGLLAMTVKTHAAGSLRSADPRLRDLLALSPEELRRILAEMGEESYRGRQLLSWVYEKGERDFALMTNMPAALRQKLAGRMRVGTGEVESVARTDDGRTAKYLFRFHDGAKVEAVSMRGEKHRTVCVSSQVGCAMGCAFCATGTLGFTRNLTAGEILLQPLEIMRREGRITSVVFMGMGEPLLNLENVLKAVQALADEERLGLGTRKITLSTCGIVPGIESLARAPVHVRLALSLNSPFQEARASLMPIARRYPLDRVLDACEQYAATTGARFTLEYVLLRGVNMSHADATALARIANRLDGKVNLIEYNQVSGLPAEVLPQLRAGTKAGVRFQSPQSRETLKFREWLEKKGISVTIRFRRGREIAAGCGQLAASGASKGK